MNEYIDRWIDRQNEDGCKSKVRFEHENHGGRQQEIRPVTRKKNRYGMNKRLAKKQGQSP